MHRTLPLVVVLFLGRALVAADIHVDLYHGNDVTGVGTPGAPYRTITYGLYAATSGDVVVVHPGVYSQANGEQFPLALPSGVELRGLYGSANTVIDGDQVLWPSQTGIVELMGDGKVSGFSFRNGPVANWWDAAIAGWGPGQVTISNNVFIGPNINRAVMLFDLTADPTSTSTAAIHNNIAYLVGPADALLAFDYPLVIIAHNTIVDGTRAAIAVSQIGAVVSGVIANNNLVHNNFFAMELNAPGLTLLNNNYNQNTGTVTGMFGSQSGALSTPSSFAMAANRDYHLRPGSPLRDAGVAVGIGDDVDGDARPFGAAVDVGADEVRLTGTALRAPFEINQPSAVDTFGAAGAAYAQFIGVLPASIPTAFGTLAFDPSLSFLLGVGMLPASGYVATAFTTPPVQPAVLGFPIIVQSLVGIGPGALSPPQILTLVQ